MSLSRRTWRGASKRRLSFSLPSVKGDRMMFLQGVCIVVGIILGLRLFTIQVLSYTAYKAAADGEHKFFKKLFPKRGEIFVKEYRSNQSISPLLSDIGGEKVFPAVMNREYKLVYAVPRDIQEREKTAETLAPILGVEKEKILEKLSKKNDAYEVLKRKLSDEEADRIKDLALTGIHFNTEVYRYYPERDLGGHVFGYLGHNTEKVKGLYGLEGYFDSILRGKEGSLRLETDAIGALIPMGENKTVEAIDGNSLVLTIDRTVQLVTCDRLKAWVLQHGADGGSVIIMDPKTGAILAMCSTPDYAPDEYGKFDIKTYNNPAIFTSYEPGSIFKPITMAIAIEMDKVSPTSTFEDTGEVKIGAFTIKNSDLKAYGRQTMTEVLNKSLNTGIIFAARKIGADAFRKYVKLFGFGDLSGIELDTESAGNINSLNNIKNEIYLATASFGQGLAVTPLQIANAYAALANGGTLMQPYIVDEIIKPDGTNVKTKPKIVRKVISERTASLIGGMLVTVVEKGHGERAGVPGYYVAGRTGSAQVARKDGKGYETNTTIGSFAGFAPVDDPRFVMLVKIDHPRDVQWAESSAAPLFGELARFLLQYYEVPPDEHK